MRNPLLSVEEDLRSRARERRLTPFDHVPVTPEDVAELDLGKCPGGGCALAKLDGGFYKGTCEDVKDEQHVRYCGPGWNAWVCPRAARAWRLMGTPVFQRPNGQTPRLQPATALPPAPPRRRVPEALADAPTMGDWAVRAPHQRGEQGEYWDDVQRALRFRALEMCEDWRATVALAPWLLLLGLPGTGKTHLLRALARSAAEAGLRVHYALFEEAIKRVKATRAPDATEQEEDALRFYGEVDLLVLDDIKPIFNTQDDENIAHRLIANRYGEDLGQRRRMVLAAANLSVAELGAVIGAAALDRFLDRGTRPWICDWPSYRRQEGVA